MLSWPGNKASRSRWCRLSRTEKVSADRNIPPWANAPFFPSASANAPWLLGGWAAELQSGEAGGGTYDSGDLRRVLDCLDQHAPSRIEIELSWAEAEAHRMVSVHVERIERLADALLDQQELTSAAEILSIIAGRPGDRHSLIFRHGA
jgi:hypothetical protein